ncbi:MAG: NADPH:quinone reductase [Alphaproteobacteria bacterium]|nr:NADPH:quinone reductase [Alphaproteobacteria bacterium]
MTHAIVIQKQGGPEEMRWTEVDVSAPGPGQVRLRQTAVGLNYIDCYHRSGLYPLEMPAGIGMEAAGIVEAMGDGVSDLAVGDRVAYASGPPGSYAEERNMAANRVVKLPDSISDETAAAMMLQGMTTQYLIRSTYRVKAGETILFHAAAGGVGLIACQWLKQLGATVIGTVGSDEKAELAKAHGCDHAIVYTRENFVDRVKEITDGAGVPVVYDSVGADTYPGSLDCLAPLGMMVSFGNASGPIKNFDPGLLAAKGSLYFTRPTLMTYTEKREDLVASANDLFAAVEKGVKIEINQRYALKDAEQAHRDLEGRKTTGSTIFLP